MELALILKTVILGIVEGVTEFIPVSSTAHLLLVGKVIQLHSGVFLEAFSIAIQTGAILAVVWYFWKTIWRNTELIGKVALAFLPTALAGLLLYPLIAKLFDSTTVVALALVLGGIGLLLIRPDESSGMVKDISYEQAFLIGLAQIASFVPGISRAGATLIGGTLMKIPRSLIVPFSFLLAIPTIAGAGVVELRHVSGELTGAQWQLIGIGMVVAFLVALSTMRFFIRLLTRKSLAWFGWYRVVIGIAILLFLA